MPSCVKWGLQTAVQQRSLILSFLMDIDAILHFQRAIDAIMCKLNLTPEWGPPSNQQQRSLHRIERERRPHSFGPVFNRGWTAESHEAKTEIGFIHKLRIAVSKFFWGSEREMIMGQTRNVQKLYIVYLKLFNPYRSFYIKIK